MENVSLKRTDLLQVKVNTPEKQLYKRAADKDGRELSGWVRHILQNAAEKALYANQ